MKLSPRFTIEPTYNAPNLSIIYMWMLAHIWEGILVISRDKRTTYRRAKHLYWRKYQFNQKWYERFHEKNQHNGLYVMYRPEQPAQSAQANPGRHIPSEVDKGIEWWFLKQKIHRRQKVSVRVSLCGMVRLVLVDTLRRDKQCWFSRRAAHIYLPLTLCRRTVNSLVKLLVCTEVPLGHLVSH